MNAAVRFVKMVTFWELFQGLVITNKYLLKPKVTEFYPDVRPVLPYRSKGRLHVEISTCISCRMCEKAFPPSKEVFKTDKRPAEFILNQEHCLHCGLCVDPCPTGSIHHSQEYELVVTNYDDLLFDKEMLPYNLDQKRYRWNWIENVPVKK